MLATASVLMVGTIPESERNVSAGPNWAEPAGGAIADTVSRNVVSSVACNTGKGRKSWKRKFSMSPVGIVYWKRNVIVSPGATWVNGPTIPLRAYSDLDSVPMGIVSPAPLPSFSSNPVGVSVVLSRTSPTMFTELLTLSPLLRLGSPEGWLSVYWSKMYAR